MTMINNLSPDMAQATVALGQNLAAAQPMLNYRTAEQALMDNQEAMALLQQLSQQQGALRQRQTQGTLTQTHLADLRQVQARVQENGVIMAYFQAQEQMNAYLQEINQEISNLIGADFAALARVSSC